MEGSTGRALDSVGPRGVAARVRRSPAQWGLAALGLVVLVGGVLLLTAAYVGAEHTLYTWDFHEYTTRLEQTYATARRSPLTALVQIYLSTSQGTTSCRRSRSCRSATSSARAGSRSS